MIKSVVFDFDGVIADSFSIVYDVQKKTAEAFGKTPVFRNHDEFRELFTTDWRKFYTEILGIHEKDLAKAGEIFREEITKLLHDIEIFEGMKEVISELHKKYKIGVVSSNLSDIVKIKLRQFDISELVDCVIGGESGKLKPDPEPLLKCIAALNAKPDETCFIGDTEDDIKTGRNAGVRKIIAVSYGYQHAHRLEGADVILHKPEEMLKEL